MFKLVRKDDPEIEIIGQQVTVLGTAMLSGCSAAGVPIFSGEVQVSQELPEPVTMPGTGRPIFIDENEEECLETLAVRDAD